jgi:hypothetical protein
MGESSGILKRSLPKSPDPVVMVTVLGFELIPGGRLLALEEGSVSAYTNMQERLRRTIDCFSIEITKG